MEFAIVCNGRPIILRMGRGVFMVKADIKEAYRMVPVHPQDRWLLGVQWEGHTFVATVLPFGLRSAPKIFSAVADAVQWILVKTTRHAPLLGRLHCCGTVM